MNVLFSALFPEWVGPLPVFLFFIVIALWGVKRMKS